MFTPKEVAEVYRLGMIVGLFEVKEVIDWADSVVMAEAAPDISFIEVSSAGNVNEGKMAVLLRDIPGDVDASTPRQVIFGLLGQRLASDASLEKEIAAQVKAIETSEGASGDISGELLASLKKFDARAAAWKARA